MAVKERISHPPPRALPERISITVGVHADAGAEGHRPANDTGAGRAVTVADVATWNEFGTGSIPQRSFIRAWFDESQDFIRETLRSQMALVAQGKLTADKAAERVALACEGSMKKRISRGVPPPNAAETIRRKGSSKPLINTGQLRNAIRGKVTLGSGTLGNAGDGGEE
jgi:hypothetical protein